MNVAAVDIGSNSTRLLIAELSGRRVTQLVRRTEVTSLGAGVDVAGVLSDDAIARVLATLDRYRAEIDAHHCERAVAVLTSAVRDSANGPQFADEVGRRYGLEVHVLSGDEESRMTYMGATGERDPSDLAPTLVVDVGGGSTELVVGAGIEVLFHVSVQAGVVRQTERHLRHDPPTASELSGLAADVQAIMAASIPSARRQGAERGIAVAGTPTSLAAIAQALEPYDPARVHGWVLAAAECERILSELSKLPLAERRAVPGLHPDRAPTILAGIVILQAAMSLFGLDRIEVSEHGILRGAVFDLILPHL